MDLHYLVHNESVYQTNQVVESVIEIYSIFCDIISTLSSLFLIILLLLKRKEKTRDFHTPIFYQLFFSSTVTLLLRGVVRFTSLFTTIQPPENSYQRILVLFLQLVALEGILFLITISDILIIVVLMFSLLAAAQKFFIVYGKKYKFLVTGKYLKVLIVLVWLFSIFYFFITQDQCLANYDTAPSIDCPENLPIFVLAFRTVFLLSMLIIIGIYYHFYKLLSHISDGSLTSKRSLLYQFVPIHILLTFYTSIGFISDLVSRFSYFDFEVAPFMTVFTAISISPLIPIVIAFSYIASLDNLRSWLRARLLPILRELSN